MSKISIDLEDLQNGSYPVGHAGEKNVDEIEITLGALSGYNLYTLKAVRNDGVCVESDEITEGSGKITVPLSSKFLVCKGIESAQVIAFNVENGEITAVKKSDVFRLCIDESVVENTQSGSDEPAEKHIIDGEVTTQKIANEAVTLEKLSADVQQAIQGSGGISTYRIYESNRNSNNGKETLDLYVLFEKGELSSGNNKASNYRARSKSIISFDRDITLVSTSDYPFFLAFYNDGAYTNGTSWITTYVIPAGTQFRIVIRHLVNGTEDKSTITDLYAFSRAITFDTVVNQNVSSISKNEFAMGLEAFSTTFVNGDLSNGNLANAGRKYRVVTKDIQQLDYSTVFIVPTEYRMYYVTYSNGVYQATTAWSNRMFIPKGTEFRIVIEIINTNLSINPAEANSIIKHYTKDRMSSVVSYDFERCEVLSSNHRGYNTIAPENTLPAFRLSAQHGFPIVESDVQWTRDNVPVLLHNDTLNQVAVNEDGTDLTETVAIADITYEQALQYDIRRGKSNVYTGTKIPTFTQWIELCKMLGLHPQIEIKGTPTAEQIYGLVDIVKKYNMERSVLWLGEQGDMQTIVDYCPVSCVGRYYNGTVTEAYVLKYAELHTGYNKVYFEISYNNYSDNAGTMFDLLDKYDIISGVYGTDVQANILSLDKRTKIIATDSIVSCDVLREANIGQKDTGI